VRRSVVSPAQLGWIRRRILGFAGLPRSERVSGDSSMPEDGGRREGVEGGPPLNPRDMAKAGLPEFQSPDGRCEDPSERRLKPMPRPALARSVGWCILRVVGRCPVRAFKEMSGTPKSRSIRTAGTYRGIA
jgi:hypothetical protein